MTEPVRIALVGAGAFGRKHLSVLASPCLAVLEAAWTGREVSPDDTTQAAA